MALMSSRALGKLAHSCCVLAARGQWLPRVAQPKRVLRTDSVFMATKVALLSSKQKEPSFPMVGTFWNSFLTIKQEKTFKRPFLDIHPPPCPGFLHNL